MIIGGSIYESRWQECQREQSGWSVNESKVVGCQREQLEKYLWEEWEVSDIFQKKLLCAIIVIPLVVSYSR